VVLAPPNPLGGAELKGVLSAAFRVKPPSPGETGSCYIPRPLTPRRSRASLS
jgi:hypothetical protein